MRKYLDSNIVYETKDMSKEEWLNARKGVIDGSDASSVLGFNPYRSSISVYLEKIQNIKHDSNKEEGKEVTYKMELGNKLEDFVASEFSLKTGKNVRNVNGILKNDKYSFALANIDRAIVSEKALLECRLLIVMQN